MNSPATVQRYDLDGYDAGTIESKDGDWVKWEDHCRVQAERDGAIEIAQMRTREIVKLREQRDGAVGLLRDMREALRTSDGKDWRLAAHGMMGSELCDRVDALVGRVGE